MCAFVIAILALIVVFRPRLNAIWVGDKKRSYMDVGCYVVLNETGNVLIKTSQDPSRHLPDHLSKFFSEAVASLCMITRAISTATNPDTGRSFSIYDHSALEQMLTKHPQFLWLTQEVTEFEVKHDEDFIRKSGSVLLGGEHNAGIHHKMNAIYASMHATACLARKRGSVNAECERLGHLTLCCENLVGVPFITMILTHISHEHCISIPQKRQKKWWDLTRKTIEYKKDTYLFNSEYRGAE
ncbi:hypothetical protein GCM10011357_30720 [Lacimicrobium alkaliphilum]|uniref:Uncharacterized protein n=1 Tax=Lacimicrobium alkaliphilum TaxID=1526571 RepID=A0ABQ1RKG4_9ALTE|nr:hypothetical protein GCM10011357_30720 [Lacimicrobium alkaliphilum]